MLIDKWQFVARVIEGVGISGGFGIFVKKVDHRDAQKVQKSAKIPYINYDDDDDVFEIVGNNYLSMDLVF